MAMEERQSVDKKIRNPLTRSLFKRYWWAGLMFFMFLIFAAGMTLRGEIRSRQYRANQETKLTLEKELAQRKAKLGPKPMLVLPFSSDQLPSTLMPMGETIAHPDTPDGSGHPGIDFQWNYTKEVKILASMDATIVDIYKNDLGNYDILTANNGWGVDYTGMREFNPELKVGHNIKSGDYIGKPFVEEHNGVLNTAYHWQFGYATQKSNDRKFAQVDPRLCPMNYFTNESKIILERIWSATKWPELKEDAPQICSNVYNNRNE